MDPPSAYPLLAEAEDQQGRRDAAIETLKAYWRAGGRSTQALARLGAWLEQAGDPGEALQVHRALALIAPLDPGNRTRLGNALMTAGRPREALAEYLAAQSLKPHDAADAHYRLARAYHTLDETEDARRHVLMALEIAPRFTDALLLLLEINR